MGRKAVDPLATPMRMTRSRTADPESDYEFEELGRRKKEKEVGLNEKMFGWACNTCV